MKRASHLRIIAGGGPSWTPDIDEADWFARHHQTHHVKVLAAAAAPSGAATGAELFSTL
jgi:hypothetical protein